MLAVVVMLSGGMASGAEVKLYAEDGTYLGKAGASPYDPESIDNPYGIYGSQYSPTSIRNPFSPYGIQNNQIGPVVRRQVTPISRPVESSMDGFWKGYRQGYDSVERMAQRRREQQAEHEQRMQEMREQAARDAELYAIEEQTREIRELRLALEAQRYQQQAMNQPPPQQAPPKKKETYRNGSPFSEEFLISIGYRKAPVEDGEGQMTRPETAEEKAARLKEEGRREWEAIKAQWAAEDAAKGRGDRQP